MVTWEDWTNEGLAARDHRTILYWQRNALHMLFWSRYALEIFDSGISGGFSRLFGVSRFKFFLFRRVDTNVSGLGWCHCWLNFIRAVLGLNSSIVLAFITGSLCWLRLWLRLQCRRSFGGTGPFYYCLRPPVGLSFVWPQLTAGVMATRGTRVAE